MTRIRGISVLIIILTAILAACRRDCVFYAYQPVNPEGWGKRDTLRFWIPGDDRSGMMSIEVGLRVKECYPFESAYVVVERRDSADTRRRRDTVCVQVRTEMTMEHAKGEQLPQGVVLHSLMTEAFTDSLQASSQQVLMYHVMPRYLLPGITEVGLKCSIVSGGRVPRQYAGR